MSALRDGMKGNCGHDEERAPWAVKVDTDEETVILDGDFPDITPEVLAARLTNAPSFRWCA
jgi:hypothetical protein